jgi:Family of unknown function (DUF5684)
MQGKMNAIQKQRRRSMNTSSVSRFVRVAIFAWISLVVAAYGSQASGKQMSLSGGFPAGFNSGAAIASLPAGRAILQHHETARLMPAEFLQTDMPSDAAARGMMALMGGSLLFLLFLALAGYVYFAIVISTIAAKTNHDNRWMAWVPILNVILLLNIASRPLWWFLLFLIPFVNIVIMVIVWMGVAKARNKPDWWGVLMIVPIANLIVPGVLAFAD